MRKDRTPPSEFDLEVAGRLRELRKDVQESTGRAVWEIAAGAHMSEQSWFQHERGETGISLAKLRELAAGLQMEPHDLFEKLFPVKDKSSSFKRLTGVLSQMVGTGQVMGFAPN
jgi:hypothetical protein